MQMDLSGLAACVPGWGQIKWPWVFMRSFQAPSWARSPSRTTSLLGVPYNNKVGALGSALTIDIILELWSSVFEPAA